MQTTATGKVVSRLPFPSVLPTRGKGRERAPALRREQILCNSPTVFVLVVFVLFCSPCECFWNLRATKCKKPWKASRVPPCPEPSVPSPPGSPRCCPGPGAPGFGSAACQHPARAGARGQSRARDKIARSGASSAGGKRGAQGVPTRYGRFRSGAVAGEVSATAPEWRVGGSVDFPRPLYRGYEENAGQTRDKSNKSPLALSCEPAARGIFYPL